LNHDSMFPSLSLELFLSHVLHNATLAYPFPSHAFLPLSPLLLPRLNIKRTLLRRLIPIERKQTNHIQRHKPHNNIAKPSIPHNHPLQASKHAVAHRPTRLRRRTQRTPFCLECCGRGAGARCVVGGFAHRGREGGRVGAADGVDDGGGFDDEEGRHTIRKSALLVRFWEEVTYADTPYFFATSCCESTSTLTNCIFPAFVSFSARLLNTGAIALQGPHQSA
jgi:hypothetical protein